LSARFEIQARLIGATAQERVRRPFDGVGPKPACPERIEPRLDHAIKPRFVSECVEHCFFARLQWDAPV